MSWIVFALGLTGCASVMGELHPQPEPALSQEEVLVAARAGNAQAAFWAYQQAETRAERRKWICISANRDFPEAQIEISQLHWRAAGIFTSPFRRDAFVAYVWSIIAISRGQDLGRNEERLTQVLDEGERQRAIQLATIWQPDPSQCDNMEESEYFNVPTIFGF
jgi:hypothetical protein